MSVEPAFRSSGIGEALVKRFLDAARAAGHRLVILVGDLAYYQRMGFQPVPEGLLISRARSIRHACSIARWPRTVWTGSAGASAKRDPLTEARARNAGRR